MEKTYIFGHKKPDTDSVTSSIALSYLKNRLGEETEPRVLGQLNKETEYALDYLKDQSEPTVIDLCSGSGCIAVSIAAERPDAKVFAVEKFPHAFKFLLSNIEKIGVKNVNAVNGDIFDTTVLSDIEPDLILSNPPYIRTSDLSGLQEEVKKEPVTALDGGRDGYDFYRVLASHWMKKLSKGGLIAVECGEDQTEYISELFKENADSVETFNDLSGLPRIVGAII